MPVACCYICGASFGAPQTLNRHIKEVHNTENILTVNCSQCDYVGKQRNLLNHISRVHGEKKICEMCDKPFHDKAINIILKLLCVQFAMLLLVEKNI